jgi:hypothetical protein
MASPNWGNWSNIIMADYNILEWQNENRLSNFPFESEIVLPDFIVDAKFVQFDNFTPILNYIQIGNNSISVNIQYDDGIIDALYIKNSGAKSLRLYSEDSYRHIGVLTLGPGAETLLQTHVGQKFTYEINFAPETVISIPSTAGVFELDGNFGEVSLSRSAVDTTIFYNINTEFNSITFNAVAGHEAVGPAKGLRQINLVKPKNNNINILTNDVLKLSITSADFYGLDVKLISGNPVKSFNLPTLY